MPASILIIDDYADNRELIRLMLEQAGYLVHEASDGAAGLEIARNAQPDIALVDLSMPGLDGWEVLKILRADEDMAAMVCVAVSAYADGARMRALDHGFDAYLTKPFRRLELLETVADLLANRKNQIPQTKSDSAEKVV
jgi:CheY-like chemotaxis protein